MSERLARHLHPEVRNRLLPLAKRLTGRNPRIEQVDSLPSDVKAMLVRPEQPNAGWQIRLRRGQERIVDHLVAHEVGHIERLYRVPEEERLMPVLTQENRRLVAETVAPDLMHLASLGLPEEELVGIFNTWLEGLGSQLGSFPADLRIEAWIHERYPVLRRVQERSLVDEVQRGFPLLAPEVEALTPEAVHFPTTAMNAAQAWQMARLYKHPELLIPYQQHGFALIGRRLAEAVLDLPDEGHRSDMAAVNAWAKELRLTGWFGWAAYEGSR